MPEVDIPVDIRGVYYLTLDRLLSQMHDLEGKLPMLYLFFKEAENVRGLAIIVCIFLKFK